MYQSVLLLLSSCKSPLLAEKCECNRSKDYSFPKSRESTDWKRVLHRLGGMRDEPFLPRECRIEGNLKWGCGIVRGQQEVGYFCGGVWELLIFLCGKQNLRWLKSLKQCKQNMLMLNFSLSLLFLFLFRVLFQRLSEVFTLQYLRVNLQSDCMQ